MPKISVIVPVYKVEPYLRRCVDSILAQTFTDFELILVDDGSPDECGKICDEYAKKQSCICVIHQKNGGLSAARNAGIDWALKYSDSKWLGFVDSDDWIHPNMYETLLSAALQYDMEISVCGFIRTKGEERTPAIVHTEIQRINGLEYYTSKKFLGATMVWNKLYWKELFSQVHFPLGKLHEDEFTTYKLLFLSGDVAIVNCKLYYYYMNEQGIMLSKYTLQRLDAIEAIEQQCAFFSSLENQCHYRRGVVRLVTVEYPGHIRRLQAIGEQQKAKELRKKGRQIVLGNLSIFFRLNKEQKEYILGVFFPVLDHIVTPCKHFVILYRQRGFKNALHYYIKKFY